MVSLVLLELNIIEQNIFEYIISIRTGTDTVHFIYLLEPKLTKMEHVTRALLII